MTLDAALPLGQIEAPEGDPLRGCKTASAISRSGRCLYTVVETPLGERFWNMVSTFTQADSKRIETLKRGLAAADMPFYPGLVPPDLDWHPGTQKVREFRERHQV